MRQPLLSVWHSFTSQPAASWVASPAVVPASEGTSTTGACVGAAVGGASVGAASVGATVVPPEVFPLSPPVLTVPPAPPAVPLSAGAAVGVTVVPVLSVS